MAECHLLCIYCTFLPHIQGVSKLSDTGQNTGTALLHMGSNPKAGCAYGHTPSSDVTMGVFLPLVEKKKTPIHVSEH